MSEPDDLEPLLKCALEHMARAYAPYSRFHVGAAIRSTTGRLYGGANVENIARPLGWCAETSALGAMIAGGESRIAAVLIVGATRNAAGEFHADPADLSTPCGGCRQRLHEFADSETPIHICGPEGVRRSFTLAELLPYAFAPRGANVG